jgi:glycosyltransferase involved in cell wall biosynthesis
MEECSIRIGYIIARPVDLFEGRGDFVHIYQTLKNLASLGNDVILICQKDGDNKKISSIKTYSLNWVSPIGLPYFPDIIRCSFNFKIYRAGCSIIKKEKLQVLHERQTYFNYAGLLLARKFNLPFILEVNAPITVEQEVWHSFIFRKLGATIEEKLFSHADRIIVVSNELKKYVLKFNVTPDKITVIPNGVDINLFNPKISGTKIRRKYGLNKDKVVCFIGSLMAWHGAENIIRVANEMADSHPKVKFLIVGSGTLEEKLKTMAGENVVFTGSVEHKLIPEYLAASDIAVAPYPKMDFFYFSPIKLFEYMASGKAIVASDMGQIGEVIEHEKTGLLIEPGNVRALKESIEYLLDNPQLRRKLGRNARKAAESYTWENNAKRVMKIYEELINAT